MKYLAQIWNSKGLRNKILFSIFGILVFRFVGQISIPNADLAAIQGIFQKNALLGAFNILTGGSAEHFSILLMGLSPYINASIIVQLLTVISPRLEALSKEGEQGQKKLSQYTRWLTVPLALLQSYGMIALLNRGSSTPIVPNIDQASVILPIMLTVTAGTVFLMWIGELMTEKGIGNGISLLIFAGIITAIPQTIAQNLFIAQQDTGKIVGFGVTILITIALAVFVILVTEAQRKIPITYAGRGVRMNGGDPASLPIRINQAGMIPIIFAVSVTSFPGLIAQFLVNAKSEWLRTAAGFVQTHFTVDSLAYILVYGFMIMFFTFFYVSITFNPEKVAENIQKNGGYIPGIRPGTQTVEYIKNVSNRLNLWGGLFIGFVALLPILLSSFMSSDIGSLPLLLGGAGMIIVVGVVLEIIRQINAQLIMHDYQKFY
ncbi:MAG: preprotein translocase subunit SecY [Patescibacteria group bacterium]